MGEKTGIQWCDHTFNPWWGCTKVSDGCKHCYAETLSNRFKPGYWGPSGDRRLFEDGHWQGPLKWDRKAAAAGERRRVFAGSMCDVFEDRTELEEPRKRLLQLIDATKNLDWLLLTKRPENVLRLLSVATHENLSGGDVLRYMPNIWIGTSVEDQDTADKRIPDLLNIPARIRFLSCEPLLGPLDLTHDLDGYRGQDDKGNDVYSERRISWVIAGGESGPDARPMHPDWAYSLRDQCQDSGVSFFFKQWGAWWPNDQGRMVNVGKHAAGRLLDGREWNEFPA